MKLNIIKAAAALLVLAGLGVPGCAATDVRPRVIVTTDGEADDKASMVRFLLTCNEFGVEAIVNSSSEFHRQGGRGWNALQPVEWVSGYTGLYAKVCANLKKHSPLYPEPGSLPERTAARLLKAVRGARVGIVVTADARHGDTIHFVCTVTGSGTPALTRYARVVITVD